MNCAQRAEAVRLAPLVEGVGAVGPAERQVDVEAGAALVVERPGHEGGEQAFARRHLLHRRLQQEGAVGGVDRRRVLDVDLVLRVHELVVGGERLEAELVAGVQHLEHDPARIRDEPDRVDARELVDVAAQAAGRRGVALEQEELELGADHRHQVALGVALDDGRQQAARADGPAPGAVRPPEVADAPGHVRLPGHDAQRADVRPDRQVDVSLLAADDRGVAEIGRHHGRAERDSLLGELLEVPDRDVLAPRDPVQVGVEQPDGAHAALRSVATSRVVSLIPSPAPAAA